MTNCCLLKKKDERVVPRREVLVELSYIWQAEGWRGELSRKCPNTCLTVPSGITYYVSDNVKRDHLSDHVKRDHLSDHVKRDYLSDHVKRDHPSHMSSARLRHEAWTDGHSCLCLEKAGQVFNIIASIILSELITTQHELHPVWIYSCSLMPVCLLLKFSA